MGQYKVYSEEEKRWITLPMAFQGEQGVKGEPGDDGVTPMFKIVSGMWNVSYDNGRTWGEVGPANGTSINDVQAIVDSSTGTPSATASYSGPDNARTLTFRFSGLKGEQGPKGADGVAGKDGVDGKDGQDGRPGQDGADGMDGSVYEYVYYRGLDVSHKPSTPEHSNEDDYRPKNGDKNVTVDGLTFSLGWTDKAQGVDNTYKFEWRSERQKLDTNTWSEFTEPILWAKYGEKGKDGDGVQYIFKLTDSNIAPSNPTPENYATDSAYQNSEGEEFIPEGWTDDPEQTTDTMTHCWVSVRKYRNGKWLGYSNPTLWSKYVADFNGVVADSIVIEMDPDMVMVNEDENTAKTTIRAYRGNDTINIAKIEVVEDGGCTIKTPEEKEDFSWDVEITNIDSNSSIVSIKLAIYMSNEEGAKPRYKTFRIYQTKYDAETATLNFDDDNVLIPCPDGNTPAEGFFDNFTIPVAFRIGGVNQSNFTLTADTSDNNWFELSSDKTNLVIKAFPGTDKTANVQFTATSGQTSATASIRFTKFDTKGGTISMYSLRADSNKIVCDTRGTDGNKYTVYSGKTEAPNNTIKAIVSCYSTDGNKQVSIASLPSNYAVFYCIDPQDYHENTSSTYGEYVRLTDAGIKIGGEGANSELELNPDTCVSFQLREWIDKEKEPWSVVNEECYTVWDTENILVDIIRDIAAYKFVFTPDKIHIKHDKTLSTDKIVFGMSKNKAGDGDPTYEVLKEIPTGYDVYYSFDDGLTWNKIGGEGETDDLPAEINLLDESGAALVDQHILVKMVINENDGSLDDDAIGENNITVLSETIEVTSEIPGKSAYVGYLTDSMGIVSCDAQGNPSAGLVLSTEFKVTNAKNVTVIGVYTDKECSNQLESGVKCDYTINGGVVEFSNFTKSLAETEHLYLKAKYVDENDTAATEDDMEFIEGDILGYTIAKLKIAEASTILDFSNDNIVIPCDSTGTPLVTSAETYVAMFYGDKVLNISTESVELGEVVNNYRKIVIPIDNSMFGGKDSYNWVATFTGIDSTTNVSYTRTGQVILSKVEAGESGKVWDLVMNTDTPRFNNDTDKFDDDYIEGWVNAWSRVDGVDTWGIASVDDNGFLDGSNRCIVYKANDITASEYTKLVKSDFEGNKFRIYINPVEGKKYVDLDSNSGIIVSLAEHNNGVYTPIQSEIVKASFNGRDFSKFELVLSDEYIVRTHQDGQIVEVSPSSDTGVGIVGIFEHSGVTRSKVTKTSNGTFHNHEVAGLDIYYATDLDMTTIDISNVNVAGLHKVVDQGNDGYVTNNHVPISADDSYGKLDVLLLAHYDDPDVEGNATKLVLVDHKELKVIRVDMPDTLLNYRVSLDQDNIVVPVDNSWKIDPEFTFTIEPKLYCNDALVNIDSEEFKYATGSNIQPSGSWKSCTGAITLEADELVNKPTHLWVKYEYVLNDAKLEETYVMKSCRFTYSRTPIELFVDKQTVKKDMFTNTVKDSVSLEVKKWNYTDNVWENTTDCVVNFEYAVADGSDYNEDPEVVSPVDGKYTVDLSKYSALSRVRFSVYNSDGGLLGFEDILVLKDGTDGDSQEFLYYRCNVDYIDDQTLVCSLPSPDKIADVDTSNFQDPEWKPNKSYENINWTDDPSGVNTNAKYEYVSVRKRSVGEWQSFSTPSLWAKYGEQGPQGIQGPKGADGAGVSIKGSYDTLVLFTTALTGAGDNPITSATLGDAYLVAGELYVYKGVGNNIDFKDIKSWENVGKISGDSAFIHIRFSNKPDGGKADGSEMWDIDDLGAAAGKYMGIYRTGHDHLSAGENIPSNFTWTKWTGDDGWGYEHAFILTTADFNAETPVKIPKGYDSLIDNLPDHEYGQGNLSFATDVWQDCPQQVTEQYPYCWQISRAGISGQMKEWQGNGEYAVLYNQYVTNGKDAIFEIFKIHNQMDQIFVDAEDHPIVDHTFETKAVVINQNGETILDASEISVNGYNITTSGDLIQFTIPKDKTISGDLNVTFEYNGQTQTMFIKRIKGVTEYSLEADHTYVIKGEVDKVNLSVITKTVGTGNSEIVTSTTVPSGHKLTLYKNGAILNTYEDDIPAINTSDLKGGDVIEAKLTQGDTLVDYVTIEIIETSIRFVLNNPFDQLIVNGNNQIDDPDVSSGISNWSTMAYLYKGNNEVPLTDWVFKGETKFNEDTYVSKRGIFGKEESEDVNKHVYKIDNFDYKITYFDSNNNTVECDIDFLKYTNLDDWGNDSWLYIYFSTSVDYITLPKEVAKVQIEFTTTYNGIEYSAVMELKVISAKDDYDIYVGSNSFKYSGGKANSLWGGDGEDIYIKLYKKNDVVFNEGLCALPEGYRMDYGYISNNVETTVKTFSAGSEYSYLNLEEIGGIDNDYTRFVKFGRASNSTDSLDVIDQQYIPAYYSDNHLELSNNYQVIQLDPNNNVLDLTEIQTEIKLVEGGKTIASNTDIEGLKVMHGNTDITDRVGEYTGLYYQISKGTSISNIEKEIVFSVGDLSAKMILNTSSSWEDYDINCDKYIVYKGDSEADRTVTISLTKKTIGQKGSSEILNTIPFNKLHLHINNKDNSYGSIPTFVVPDVAGKYSIILKAADNTTVLDQVDIDCIDIQGKIDEVAANLEGARGRMLYPAGVWKEDGKYRVTKNATPYVQYAEDNKYYILKSENDIEVSGSDKNPFNTEYWEPMESFSSVFTEAIVAQHGNIGGAVYYQHYVTDGLGKTTTYEFMYSKEGTTNAYFELNYNDSGDGTYWHDHNKETHFCISARDLTDGGEYNPIDWTPDTLMDAILADSVFIPNVLICFTTGDAWYSQGAVKFKYDGSGSLNDAITWDSEGTYINGSLTAQIDGYEMLEISDSAVKAGFEHTSEFILCAQKDAIDVSFDGYSRDLILIPFKTYSKIKNIPGTYDIPCLYLPDDAWYMIPDLTKETGTPSRAPADPFGRPTVAKQETLYYVNNINIYEHPCCEIKSCTINGFSVIVDDAMYDVMTKFEIASGSIPGPNGMNLSYNFKVKTEACVTTTRSTGEIYLVKNYNPQVTISTDECKLVGATISDANIEGSFVGELKDVKGSLNDNVSIVNSVVNMNTRQPGSYGGTVNIRPSRYSDWIQNTKNKEYTFDKTICVLSMHVEKGSLSIPDGMFTLRMYSPRKKTISNMDYRYMPSLSNPRYVFVPDNASAVTYESIGDCSGLSKVDSHRIKTDVYFPSISYTVATPGTFKILVDGKCTLEDRQGADKAALSLINNMPDTCTLTQDQNWGLNIGNDAIYLYGGTQVLRINTEGIYIIDNSDSSATWTKLK